MPMIQLSNVSFSYRKKRILNNLSFTAEAGQCVVFAGPNGSGKSTALSLIAGILRPASGHITCDDAVGLIPQGNALFEDMTVRDNLHFFAGLKKCPVPQKLPFGIEQYLDTRVSHLSGGMQKQVSIACALLGDPKVILLDEPCASLDVQYRQELIHIISQLKDKGCTIVYVSHDPLEFSPFYDKLVFFGEHTAVYDRRELSGEDPEPLTLIESFTALFRKESHHER